MAKVAYTVVIPTYNRAQLVGRAIESALAQGLPDVEIIVVDDASRDNTAEVVSTVYPSVRYIRQDTNQGPGAARNRGICEASNPFAVMLDDDDTLVPGALDIMAGHIEAFGAPMDAPVFQFAHSNGSTPEQFRTVSFEDYIFGIIQGDFVPVVQVSRFLELGLTYPASRVGAEHLLWWHIALQHGIPTWDSVVADLHTDGSHRLTSMEQQFKHARQHAEAQELTLKQFGDVIKTRAPHFYSNKKLGAATYWLLCGERGMAREHLREKLPGSHAVFASALWALSFMPRSVTRRLLTLYRRLG